MNIVGIDLGGTRIKTGIVTDGALKAVRMIDTITGASFENHLASIQADIISLQQETGIAKLDGIALAFPGLVDTKNNRVIDTSNKYDDALSLNITDWAKDTFGLELKLENDARLACMGEWKYGAGIGTNDMVMCTLGTGVGTSAIINGSVLKGKHFQAGILGGHSVIDFKTDSQCSCGGFGCVESTASSWRIKSLAEKHPLFKTSLLCKAAKIDIASILQLSILGDELAVILKDHCISAWSAGIINLIHAYDPEIVVLGGGIMNSADIFIPEFKRIIKERAWCPSGMPEIKQAHYPDTAALLGAMTLFDTSITHEEVSN